MSLTVRVLKKSFGNEANNIMRTKSVHFEYFANSFSCSYKNKTPNILGVGIIGVMEEDERITYIT